MVRKGNFLIPAREKEKDFEELSCRYRSLGCSPCTGAFESHASSVSEIIDELNQLKLSERSARVIDHDSDSSMEDKKREGYF